MKNDQTQRQTEAPCLESPRIQYVSRKAKDVYAEKKGVEKVAREMLKEQFPAETIARLTGLTEEQVRAL